jgi:hypothetical protein
MQLLPITAGAASSAVFTVAPSSRSTIMLVDTDGVTINTGATVSVHAVDANGQTYPYGTLRSGRDTQRLRLDPGDYLVVRADNDVVVGVMLIQASDVQAPAIAAGSPAVSARAALHGWNGSVYERLNSVNGRLQVVVDAQRFASATIVSLTFDEVFAPFASQAADYIELTNLTGKTVEYRRGGAGVAASILTGTTRRIELPSGNVNALQLRNATDVDDITVTADAISWLQ